MTGSAQGEANSPDVCPLSCSGSGRCGNPIRVAPAGVHFGALSGGVRRRLIETLRHRRARRVIAAFREVRERRSGEVRAKAVAVMTLEGRNPREAPVIDGLNPRWSQGTSGRYGPRNRGLSGRPYASASGVADRLTIRGFFLVERAVETFREVKPSKGESQERRRCETKPARDSREETVKRVTKP